MWGFGRRKYKERELSDVMAKKFQELQESLTLRFEQLDDRHDKAAMATENVRKALEKDTSWKLAPADGFYQRSEDAELHSAVFLPLTPEYELTLRISNRTYNSESVVTLVISRKFMQTRVSTLEDGHQVLIVSVNRDLAPRSFVAALHTLLEPEEAGVWLDTQEIYHDELATDHVEKQRVAIIAYPFRRDLSFNVETNTWEHGDELYFDCDLSFRNILTYPLAALTPTSPDKENEEN
jgi:hypothetical protein